MTRAPRATASWTVVLPIPPEAPLMNSVRPLATASWSRARVPVSSALGSPAASTNPSDGGMIARKVSKANSAAPAPSSEMPNTRSPTATSVTPSPTSSTTPATSRPVVCPADAGGAYNDPDLTGTRMRVGKIHYFQDLGAPELAELCCLHDVPFNSAQAGAP